MSSVGVCGLLNILFRSYASSIVLNIGYGHTEQVDPECVRLFTTGHPGDKIPAYWYTIVNTFPFSESCSPHLLYPAN